MLAEWFSYWGGFRNRNRSQHCPTGCMTPVDVRHADIAGANIGPCSRPPSCLQQATAAKFVTVKLCRAECSRGQIDFKPYSLPVGVFYYSRTLRCVAHKPKRLGCKALSLICKPMMVRPKLKYLERIAKRRVRKPNCLARKAFSLIRKVMVARIQA